MMAAPGIYDLGDLTVTAAGAQAADWITNLDGMQGVTIQTRFIYGAGGTSVLVFVQTSFDQGVTPFDLVCFEFGTASGVYVVNLSSSNVDEVLHTPMDGELSPGYIISGPLGDRLRLKVISTGTYSGGTLVSTRASVR